MKAIIIGGGLGGLAISSLLKKEGFDVYLFEKNQNLGGRANFLKEKGYFFDTGPSWVLMDDIFQYYFSIFNKDFHKELNLIKLDPIFKIFFEDNTKLTFYSDILKNESIFENLEKGSFLKFKEYMELMESSYFLVRDQFILNEINFFNLLNPSLLDLAKKINPFENIDKYLRKKFENIKIIKSLEFNSLFLGTNPKNSPSIFGMINYFMFNKGVYYPPGGIYKIIEKIIEINKNLGVNFFVNKEVKKIIIENKKAKGIVLENGDYVEADLIISNVDLQYTEMKLIDENKYRTYDENFWRKIKLSPSAFIIFLGLKKKIENITHHNFYFCDDWDTNFKQIFNYNKLPDNPSFYISSTSIIENSVAPQGNEQFFILIPISAGLKINEKDKSDFKNKIYKIIEEKMEISNFKNLIDFEKIFEVNDFINYYNSFQGNALGPIHNLKQTIFRPKNKSKKIDNLYYVGAYVNPGIGMPMVIASAIITYKKILNDFENIK